MFNPMEISILVHKDNSDIFLWICVLYIAEYTLTLAFLQNSNSCRGLYISSFRLIFFLNEGPNFLHVFCIRFFSCFCIDHHSSNPSLLDSVVVLLVSACSYSFSRCLSTDVFLVTTGIGVWALWTAALSLKILQFIFYVPEVGCIQVNECEQDPDQETGHQEIPHPSSTNHPRQLHQHPPWD